MEKSTESQQKGFPVPPKRKYSFKMKNMAEPSISSLAAGQWSLEENLSLAAFMEVHYSIFSCKERRKSTKVFTFLSQYLKTRSAQQCRSHFQKLMAKYQTINKFKAKCKKSVGNQAFNEKIKGCPNFQNIFFDKLMKDQEKNAEKSEKKSAVFKQSKMRKSLAQTDIVKHPQAKQNQKQNQECQPPLGYFAYPFICIVPQYFILPF